MGAEEVAADGEAEAGAVDFGREPSTEGVAGGFGIHSGAVVREGHDHVIADGPDFHLHPAGVRFEGILE